jgi:hypothetical protein
MRRQVPGLLGTISLWLMVLDMDRERYPLATNPGTIQSI